MPRGHGKGRYSAGHLRAVERRSVLIGLSPIMELRESDRWQIVWWADILPQSRGLSTRRLPKRRRIAFLASGWAKVFKLPSILPTTEVAMYSRDVEQEGHANDWNPLPTS